MDIKKNVADVAVTKEIKPGMKSSPEQIEFLSEKIAFHIEKNKTPFNLHYRMCIDGRYENEDSAGVAIPGGDSGLVLALAEFFPADKAHKYVVEYLESKGYPFCSHTDEHEGHDGCITGCGHINAAIINNDFYSMPPDEAQNTLDVINKNHDNTDTNTHKVVLKGSHGEQAIIINMSTETTIAPFDKENDIQFFIYDKGMHLEIIKNICEFQKTKGVNINYDSFVDASTRQAMSTLALLGSSKGKEIFTVDFDENGNQTGLTFIGNAPTNE